MLVTRELLYNSCDYHMEATDMKVWRVPEERDGASRGSTHQ